MSNHDAHLEHKAENLQRDASDKIEDLQNRIDGKPEDSHYKHQAQNAANNASDKISDYAADIKQGAINLKDKITK